jgi:PAS domain S-box-containing protein
MQDPFRLLVESVKDYAIFMLDPHGYVASWNPGAEHLKGYRADEIIGRHFSIFYPAEDVEREKPPRELEVAIAEGRLEDEGWRVRKDGTLFWANVVITSVYDGTGVLRGFAKVTRDLTERRRADEERIRLARTEAALELHEEFLSIASHELRTPLGALRLQLAAVELLLKRAPHPDARIAERIRLAVRQVTRMNELIEKLLDASRLTTGRLALTVDDVELVSLVQAVAQDFEDTARHAGCELRLDVPEEPIRGRFDRLRIEQVLGNLLSNACKYGTGFPVDVSLRHEKHAAVFRVVDRGPGIPPEDRLRIFDRFERGTRARQQGGLGLGLYIASHIVDAHGGRIDVESAPGGGAELVVELPLDRSLDADETAPESG